jgi:tetratricopeptide (TPR) repeat protein
VSLVVDEELAGLLAAGERAVFRGVPGQGLVPLERAEALAEERADIARRARAAWLLGVCRSATGAYGPALAGLTSAASDPEVPAELRSLPASAVGAIQRQLGRHAEGRDWDRSALDSSAGDPEAECEALLGLASDAVGLGEPDAAQDAVDRVELLLADRPLWWRHHIRLDWARAEAALLAGDPGQARAAAERALDAAEAASAPRHVAKSLLFAGVAATSAGQQAAAVDLLARAAVLAEGLGARPLVWPSRGLLGALLAGSSPVESERSLEGARAVIRGIAAELPPLLAAEWLARRDIRALLG